MTKKEIAKLTFSNFHPFMADTEHLGSVFRAIIDALPDEAKDPYEREGFTIIDHPSGFCSHTNCYKCRKTEEVMSEQELSTEDARKLRIMKAMEDTARGRPGIYFVCDSGVWSFKNAIGTWPMNDMYSPEEKTLGGQEPVEVKESQPTSAYSGHCAKEIEMTHKLEWFGPIGDPSEMHVKCKNCGEVFGAIAVVILQQPDGSTAFSKCPAILGHKPEPPATIGVTQAPYTHEELQNAPVSETDKRWAAAPLWEGEVFIVPEHPKMAYQAGNVDGAPGWRRIKVREVR